MIASGTLTGITNPVAVTGTFFQTTQPVSGTFFQTTQPISAAALPLPSGASTEATLSTINGKITACNTGAVTISAELPAGTQNIGDVDVASIAAGTNTIGGTISQASSSTVYDGTTACTVKRFSVVATADDGTVIPAPTGTKKIRVLSMSIIAPGLEMIRSLSTCVV